MSPTSSPGRTSQPSSAFVSAVPYRVLISRAARDQLRGAPPLLLGYVDGILAVLRVDPDAATAAFDIRISSNGLREALFAGGRGFLDFRVSEEQQVVFVYDVTWLG
jgi:hypothetical protein